MNKGIFKGGTCSSGITISLILISKEENDKRGTKSQFNQLYIFYNRDYVLPDASSGLTRYLLICFVFDKQVNDREVK